ncbi:MAG: glycosyltransferase family 1 protein [Candidatus Omnitrophota bacterium]|jgi:hypothetical protein|nr:MAG: glycosyltransferase family 1 protein [Candidatus Omnitrophota bacterium]
MPFSVSPQHLTDLARRLAQRGALSEARHIMTLAKRFHIAAKIQRGEKPVIYIAATSDDEKDEFMKFLWGDYWVQYELIKGFGSLGYRVSKINPDVVIHLYGHPRQLPQHTYNIIWIYSNPATIRNGEDLRQYDWIYVLSESYQKVVQDMGRQADVMIGATSKTPFPACSNLYPAVFVGNARRGKGNRPVVECLRQCSYPFKVWGNGWEHFLSPDCIGGRYHDYQQLDRLYAHSDFSLNDHHADMRSYGFVAVKIFDILASGGFAISDKNCGIEPIFGDTVPQFADAKELQAIFDRYAPGREAREVLLKKGREIALSHTWEDRTMTFMQKLEAEWEWASLSREIETVVQLHQGGHGIPPR